MTARANVSGDGLSPNIHGSKLGPTELEALLRAHQLTAARTKGPIGWTCKTKTCGLFVPASEARVWDAEVRHQSEVLAKAVA